MKFIYLLFSLVCSVVVANAQGIQFKIGKEYNEATDSTALPPQLVSSLRKLAPNAKDVSWGHVFCTKCPKDGTYSYYEAEFYQGDEQGNILFSENAIPVAFKLKIDLTQAPGAVQASIGKVVKKLERDFQKINLEITFFNIKEKLLYGVTFYIPTEDKKHWTQYEELVFTEGGSITKLKETE